MLSARRQPATEANDTSVKARQLAWLIFSGVVIVGGLALGLTVSALRGTAAHDPQTAGDDTLVLLAIALFAALLAFGWISLVTSRWSSRLKRVTHAARELAHGRLAAGTEISGADEFALLARFLNELRDRLIAQSRVIEQHQRSLENLLDRINEGVVIADANGRIVAVNRAAETLLNVQIDRRRGLVGTAVERWISDHDLQRLLVPETPNAGPIANDEAVDQAHVLVEGGNSVRHLLARAARVPLPASPENDGAAPGRLLVLTDITELERTLQVKADFVTNASHELRTPLSTIRTAVETLQQFDLMREAEAAAKVVRIIDRQSARLSAMVSDLLDLARIESPLAKFEPRDLSAREAFADLEDRFSERIHARQLRWEVQIDDAGRSTFAANPQLLTLVLDNLVDNAIKFTEAGKLIRVSYRGEPQSAIFIVADEGCGIPEADQERVFERFYQVERARSGTERGTGLGLAIVRHAVAALGGDVALQSAIGRGTTITVRIPVTSRSAPAVRA
jgi:signal transduction histidine kinase